MADRDRFGRSERAYSGVSDIHRGDDFWRGRVDQRFGPSEKQFTKRHYTPSGLGTTWGDTGKGRRKMPGYDEGSRPPRGLASFLLPSYGRIGQDPRSSTYGDDFSFAFGAPDDLRGYRASVANVAAANAAEEQERLNNQWRYNLTSPGSGIGLENVDEAGNQIWAIPKDPRDVGSMSEMAYDWPFGPIYRDTSNMRDYRQSWDPQMNEQTKLNLDLLADLDRGGTDAYRFANTAPVSIGERESRMPQGLGDLMNRFLRGEDSPTEWITKKTEDFTPWITKKKFYDYEGENPPTGSDVLNRFIRRREGPSFSDEATGKNYGVTPWWQKLGGAMKDEFGGSAMAGELQSDLDATTGYGSGARSSLENLSAEQQADLFNTLGIDAGNAIHTTTGGAGIDEARLEQPTGRLLTDTINPPNYPRWQNLWGVLPWSRGGLASLRR